MRFRFRTLRVLPLLTVVAAAVVAVASSGAAPTATAPQIPQFTFLHNAAMTQLNTARSNASVYVVRQGLDQLLTYSREGKIQPNLAASWRQPNRFTWQYTLRKGVKFWDGNELTADDAVNALNYYRFPSSLTSGDGSWSKVRNIFATGRYTFTVDLKRPDAAWQATLATGGGIFEKKSFDKSPATFGDPSNLPIGTGPWMFTSLNPLTGAELDANPHWWGGRVPIKHVTVKFITDPTAQALAMRGGQGDFMPQIGGNPPPFASTSGLPVVRTASCGYYYFSMNVTKPPFDDVHVRRAVAYVINRQEMMATGIATAALPPVLPTPIALQSLGSPKAVAALYKALPQFRTNVAKAKAEMAQSKYPNGFTWSALAGSSSIVYAQVLAQQFAQLGLNMKVQAATSAQTTAVLFGPREDVTGIPTSNSCVSPDPSVMLNRLYDSHSARVNALNTSNYKSPQMDALLVAAKETSDPAKRLAAYGKVMQLAAKDMPYVMLFAVGYNWAIQPNFKWNYNPYWYFRPWLLDIRATK